MCTAIKYKTRSSYFGRNLDLEYSLGEGVIITPRNYPFSFLHTGKITSHYAIMGIGIERDGYPLYYDAINERGLWMAGLNFPHSGWYGAPKEGDVASFELIPYLLGRCATVAQAKEVLMHLWVCDTAFSAAYAAYNRGRCNTLNLGSFELIPYILSKCASTKDAEAILKDANLTSDAFSPSMPPTPLHWIVCDSERCIVVEPVKDGLKVQENTIGVLTNSPPFDYQMQNLTSYLSLTPYPPASRFSENVRLEPCSRGMGGIGLPGDVSSTSRFVRAAFNLSNSCSGESEYESIGQFFHIMASVAQISGVVRLDEGKLERTQYTSCVNAKTLVYYYTTYENTMPCAVDMNREALDSEEIVIYPLLREMKIEMQN